MRRNGGIIGLVHDLDYEKFPEEHCKKSEEILKEKGWPEEYIRAVVSHGWGLCSVVEPQTELEKVLYTIDELTGLVVTTALVRPSKSIMDVKVKSVKKKWKDKRFAAGVDRSIILKGAEMLGMEISDVIADTHSRNAGSSRRNWFERGYKLRKRRINLFR